MLIPGSTQYDSINTCQTIIMTPLDNPGAGAKHSPCNPFPSLSVPHSSHVYDIQDPDPKPDSKEDQEAYCDPPSKDVRRDNSSYEVGQDGNKCTHRKLTKASSTSLRRRVQ